MVLGAHSSKTFEPLWILLNQLKCYFYVTDGCKIDRSFIADLGTIISKKYMKILE